MEVTGVPPDIAHPLAEELSGYAGQPVDYARLDQDILELDGTGPYSGFNYSIVQKDGKQGLNIEAQPKPYSPPVVRPLILIDGSDYNNVCSASARASRFTISEGTAASCATT